MGLFGGDDKRSKADALRAEVERLERLPLAALGEEILTRCFGPGGKFAGGGRASVNDLVKQMSPAGRPVGAIDQVPRFEQLIGEGAQTLEHAGLLMWDHVSFEFPKLMTTRAGDAAIGERS